MLSVTINSDDLMRWIRVAEQSRGKITVAIVDALNEAGDALKDELANDLASSFEAPVGDMQALIRTARATPGDLSYEIDTRLARALELPPSGRRMGGRAWSRRPEEFFREEELVKIVSSGDNLVCERCQDLEGTVHSIEEARLLIPAHPNCRCNVISARARRLPVKYKTRIGPAIRVHTESVTLATLANRLRDIPRIALKVT